MASLRSCVSEHLGLEESMRILSPLFVPFIAVVVALPAALLFLRIDRNAKLRWNLLLSETIAIFEPLKGTLASLHLER